MINIIVIVGIIAIAVGAMAVVSVSNNENSNFSKDSETTINDSVIISKNITEFNNNDGYVIDEQGIKRYIISAKDSPNLND
ncbi:MAG: hypothetical protein ACW9W4_02435 [Candidatus Nitrosopumilus sp. bin_7KS]